MSCSVMSGCHSCGLLKSSPMAMGWRSSGGSGGSSPGPRARAGPREKTCGTLRPLCGFVGREALVHVVEQLDLVAELVAADFEQLDRAAHLRGAIEERLVVQRLWSPLIFVLRAVAGHAGQAHLHAHIAKSLRHQ